jgi:hypothetical protein
MFGFKRSAALLLSFSLALVAMPAPPAAAAGQTIQRIKGTVGFARTVNGTKGDVTTSAEMPGSAEAFSNCSSLAVVYLTNGAQITLGGRSVFITPGADGNGAALNSGAIHYDLPGHLATPLTIATSFGTVAISHGSGYVVVGDKGAEAVVRDGGPSDVSFTANKTASSVPGGQSVIADTSGKVTTVSIATVNNAALNQFNEGRNPLGTDSTALYDDPTNSPDYKCGLGEGAGAVGAGTAAGLLALLGLGAAGAIAIGATHGGGGNGSGGGGNGGGNGGGTPTPSGGTPTPTGGGTPTPIAGGGTPTPVGTGSGATPTPVAGATSPSGTGGLGPVILNPSSILLSPGIGSNATSTFTASQTGYSGPFTISQPACTLSLLGAPTATISGDTITVTLPSQTVAVNLFCSIAVYGGGGMSATEPITIQVTALGGAAPSPVAGALGPVVPNPASVLLNPGIGTAATQTIGVTQSGYSGPFTAVLEGCIGLGNPPTISVTGSNVVVSLPAQTVAVDLGCSAVITGGGGMSATVPITISVAALGAAPTPTSSGSAGAGPLTASPASILLDPSIASPATQNIIVSPSAEGPFTAVTNCTLPIGVPPVTSVTGNVVTVSAPAQTLTAPVACSTIITSTTTGNSVTVPVLITATVAGGAVPTPSPKPVGHGPLFAIPSSILINPGITTDAIQNIAIYDPNFTGTYTVAIAPGCLALQQPGVKLEDGNIAVLTVPGQLLNVALLCEVTISDGTSTIEVPVTISATALASLALQKRFDSIAFRPATLSLERTGASASVDVIGAHAPLSATATCPAGTMLETKIVGMRASVRVQSVAREGTCMLRIVGAWGTFGDVPIRVGTGDAGSTLALPPLQRGSAKVGSGTVVMRAGEERFVPLEGMGPFEVSANCARVADTRLEGSGLRIEARSAGACSVTARGAAGTDLISIVVQAR